MDNDSTGSLKMIIWLVIFIFWVSFQFFKKLIGAIKKDAAPQPQKDKKQPALPKKITSLRDGLWDFFEEITKIQKTGMPKSQLPRKPEPRSVPGKKQQTPTAAHKPQQKKPVSAPKEEPARVLGEIRPDLSAEGLRNAVVFSEILAPPLALRDTDDRQF